MALEQLEQPNQPTRPNQSNTHITIQFVILPVLVVNQPAYDQVVPLEAYNKLLVELEKDKIVLLQSQHSIQQLLNMNEKLVELSKRYKTENVELRNQLTNKSKS
jgi:hypothetical protein